jgi:hypothetical protein
MSSVPLKEEPAALPVREVEVPKPLRLKTAPRDVGTARISRIPGRADLLILVLLASTAFAFSYRASLSLDTSILDRAMDDTWFEADIGRVYENMSDRYSDHYRVKVHPLFSLSTQPVTYLMRKSVGIPPEEGVRLMTAVVAALWISALFAIFRLMGCRRLDAGLFSGVALTSSAFVFWFSVPETYSFGSLSIVLALLLVVVAQRQRVSDGWFVAASALTMSYTITNWMVGILAAFAARPWKRAIQITVNAFALVTLLWGVQKYLYPTAEFFLGDREEQEYTVAPTPTHLGNVTRVFAFHSVVMPRIKTTRTIGEPLNLTVQTSAVGSGGAWSQVSAGAWAILLVIGVGTLVTLRTLGRLRILLVAALSGQLVLHFLYGWESFLYVLHVVPLLVALAALGSLSRARPLVVASAAVLVVAGGTNNILRFQEAASLVEKRASVTFPQPDP